MSLRCSICQSLSAFFKDSRFFPATAWLSLLPSFHYSPLRLFVFASCWFIHSASHILIILIVCSFHASLLLRLSSQLIIFLIFKDWCLLVTPCAVPFPPLILLTSYTRLIGPGMLLIRAHGVALKCQLKQELQLCMLCLYICDNCCGCQEGGEGGGWWMFLDTQPGCTCTEVVVPHYSAAWSTFCSAWGHMSVRKKYEQLNHEKTSGFAICVWCKLSHWTLKIQHVQRNPWESRSQESVDLCHPCYSFKCLWFVACSWSGNLMATLQAIMDLLWLQQRIKFLHLFYKQLSLK